MTETSSFFHFQDMQLNEASFSTYQNLQMLDLLYAGKKCQVRFFFFYLFIYFLAKRTALQKSNKIYFPVGSVLRVSNVNVLITTIGTGGRRTSGSWNRNSFFACRTFPSCSVVVGHSFSNLNKAGDILCSRVWYFVHIRR